MNIKLFRLCTTLISGLSFIISISACATGRGEIPGDSRQTVIWQSRDQFIRIAPRETVTDASTAGNDHPAQLPIPVLRRILARPTVTDPESGMQVPLFTATEVGLLAEHVATALERSGQNEDIIFAVYGYHSALMGLAREERVTTGRIFLKEGELNLILGMVQQKVDNREDRRLAPFLPGSRFSPARLDVKVSSGATASITTLKRGDWLVFKLNSEPPEQPAHQMARPDESSPSSPDSGGERNIEERLRRLKSLRDKELIGDEEYRVKKLRILDEL